MEEFISYSPHNNNLFSQIAMECVGRRERSWIQYCKQTFFSQQFIFSHLTISFFLLQQRFFTDYDRMNDEHSSSPKVGKTGRSFRSGRAST